ncbi:hypothetical protein FOQG_12518 [Fusarium oxysporum f. sp. raphani 54005]|uniref:ABC transmembrane type-1 domain-containing protein n=1 Tax=Fusarium oxysporum f. sp. raphani 54005 TaxID=1089458 RepID=X0CKX8_FUSOX|nr:hypothetical protein FOQG_12518 [Fusarium oxysporum f. sp. raphani 54005]
MAAHIGSARTMESLWDNHIPLYFRRYKFSAQAVIFAHTLQILQLSGQEAIRLGDFWALMFFVLAIANFVVYFMGWLANIIIHKASRKYSRKLFRSTVKQDVALFDLRLRTGLTTEAVSAIRTIASLTLENKLLALYEEKPDVVARNSSKALTLIMLCLNINFKPNFCTNLGKAFNAELSIGLTANLTHTTEEGSSSKLATIHSSLEFYG